MTTLIVISNETDLENESTIVNGLFEAGLDLFHLRKPHWKVEDQQGFLKKIKIEFLDKISVHQHHETISEFGLQYCHIKESDRKKTVKKAVNLIYSTSFHNYNDLQFESHLWDYCFLSPVFDSISKTNYKSTFAQDFEIENDLYQRVFALGGINKNNIKSVFERGFFGAAVLGAIWSEPKNAIQNFIELNKLCSVRSSAVETI
jgi:thiamine-phosphate pyrophosphorylase